MIAFLQVYVYDVIYLIYVFTDANTCKYAICGWHRFRARLRGNVKIWDIKDTKFVQAFVASCRRQKPTADHPQCVCFWLNIAGCMVQWCNKLLLFADTVAHLNCILGSSGMVRKRRG